jgi:hypothetical protein
MRWVGGLLNEKLYHGTCRPGWENIKMDITDIVYKGVNS